MSFFRHRCFVLGVFVLCTAINYLDRQALATLAARSPDAKPDESVLVQLAEQLVPAHRDPRLSGPGG